MLYQVFGSEGKSTQQKRHILISCGYIFDTGCNFSFFFSFFDVVSKLRRFLESRHGLHQAERVRPGGDRL